MSIALIVIITVVLTLFVIKLVWDLMLNKKREEFMVNAFHLLDANNQVLQALQHQRVINVEEEEVPGTIGLM